MTLHARDQQALARIETRLIQSDPGFAAAFERFNEQAGNAAYQAERQARRWKIARKALAVILLPAAAGIALWAAVSGTGNDRPTEGCSTSIAASCPTHPSTCQPQGATSGTGLHNHIGATTIVPIAGQGLPRCP